jgi:hypothetical protein
MTRNDEGSPLEKGSDHVYHVKVGDGRSTEALVAAGDYGYAHSCITSENFPTGRFGTVQIREIVLLEFAGEVTTTDAMAAAGRRGLEAPTYEDALYFGVEHPGVQQVAPVAFLHEPWVGFFGRRDVLCLWSNAGRRELGLEGFDGRWSDGYRFAFIAPQLRRSGPPP